MINSLMLDIPSNILIPICLGFSLIIILFDPFNLLKSKRKDKPIEEKPINSKANINTKYSKYQALSL